MLKLKLFAAAAALALASGANAAIVIGSVTPGTDPYSGPAPTYDFDTPATTPVTIGGGVITTGTTPGSFAQPFGSTGNYYSVGPSTSSPGTIDLSVFTDIASISILWGSVDTYNTLEFIDALGNPLATFVGNDIFNPANGDQTDPNTNPVVTFLLSGTDMSDVAGLRLSSSQNVRSRQSGHQRSPRAGHMGHDAAGIRRNRLRNSPSAGTGYCATRIADASCREVALPILLGSWLQV